MRGIYPSVLVLNLNIPCQKEGPILLRTRRKSWEIYRQEISLSGRYKYFFWQHSRTSQSYLSPIDLSSKLWSWQDTNHFSTKLDQLRLTLWRQDTEDKSRPKPQAKGYESGDIAPIHYRHQYFVLSYSWRYTRRYTQSASSLCNLDIGRGRT